MTRNTLLLLKWRRLPPMSEPVSRPSLTYVVQKVLRAKIRAPSEDAALTIAELDDIWTESDPEVIDAIEET